MSRSFLTFFKKLSTSVLKINIASAEPEINTRLLKVAIIGMPNAGKSTFINNLMDRKVCPTSSKVHTTRAKAQAIFTHSDSQIIFLDTPGLVGLKEFKKYNLEKSFIKDHKSLTQADLIGVVHDCSNVWTRHRLDLKVIRVLEDNSSVPSFLILNKVDILTSKRKLLDLTRLLTENCINKEPIPGPQLAKTQDRGWPQFKEVFMVSALTGDGLADVKNYLMQEAKPAQWLFPAEVWSDETAESVIVKSVKAKLLDFLPQEIPYTLRPEMEYFDVNDRGVISTVVVVHCPSERIAKLVAGENDGKLRQITGSLQNDLQTTFHNFVKIKIVLKNKV